MKKAHYEIKVTKPKTSNREVPISDILKSDITYATRLFENNTSILTVSKLLGHSSIKTTKIYTHVLKEIKKEEIQCSMIC